MLEVEDWREMELYGRFSASSFAMSSSAAMMCNFSLFGSFTLSGNCMADGLVSE